MEKKKEVGKQEDGEEEREYKGRVIHIKGRGVERRG